MLASKRINGALIDLNGTCHIGDKLIGDCINSLKKLTESNVKYCFVTNNSKTSTAKLITKLSKIGFDIKPHLLVTASSAAANIIKTNKLTPLLLIAPDTVEEFEPYYLNQTKVIESKNYSLFDSVFIGLSKPDFVYDKLNVAFHCLHYNKDCKLYAINKAKYFNEPNVQNIIIPEQNGDENEEKQNYVPSSINSLATGAFVKGLEFAASRKAAVVGKPSKYFFEDGLNKIGCVFDECVMIGDDVNDDIYGALQHGMKGILVKTGKYLDGDEDSINPKPTATVADIDEAVEWIIKHNKSC